MGRTTAVVVDQACELAFSRSVVAGEEYADVERRHERDLFEHGAQGGTPPDDPIEAQLVADCPRRVVRGTLAMAGDDEIGEGGQVAGTGFCDGSGLAPEGV